MTRTDLANWNDPEFVATMSKDDVLAAYRTAKSLFDYADGQERRDLASARRILSDAMSAK